MSFVLIHFMRRPAWFFCFWSQSSWRARAAWVAVHSCQNLIVVKMASQVMASHPTHGKSGSWPYDFCCLRWIYHSIGCIHAGEGPGTVRVCTTLAAFNGRTVEFMPPTCHCRKIICSLVLRSCLYNFHNIQLVVWFAFLLYSTGFGCEGSCSPTQFHLRLHLLHLCSPIMDTGLSANKDTSNSHFPH